MIRFEGVTKRYADASGADDGAGSLAVDDLTLEAPTGKITVLVGPSGCGKTTTLRMVNRMITPTSGTISIDGKDTASLDVAELRRGIGYVIQHAGLFPHRTVLDNVTTVPRLLGTDKRTARARAMELIERVGLDPAMARRYPAQLSGGQQQRVGVARALAADPPVMLMDEPFSAVDPVVREQLQNEFLRLQSELGKTILFVTHDIDEAVKLGDQVAVLRVGGVLAQLDSPAKLLADPVDDFVAGFVGRDRGYRALSFAAAPELSLTDEPTVRLGARADDVRAVGTPWVLCVDDDREPLGWVRAAAVETEVTRTLLHRGGTVASVSGSLRALLDAALSSPSGRGVVAGDDGRLVGTIRAAEVIPAIEARRDSTTEEATAR
ncbi:ATP-binding cassette domain-containing protein [Terrabacter aerolatus]|uniref:ABC-type quaternary amine transporter n=1 Tax=Terrabacter aerolatus TaxID=422442 RepID=A0A512CWC7_9MICO|nr:ABC transporter ATP-binding protein [Terrabacter aerolatus]GEO28300.1 proline/glycine betaine ABC transporter ATP-binding protein [Terrabacter aerolatus]